MYLHVIVILLLLFFVCSRVHNIEPPVHDLEGQALVGCILRIQHLRAASCSTQESFHLDTVPLKRLRRIDG